MDKSTPKLPKRVRIAPGVTREDWNMDGCELKGKVNALIAAGVVKPEWFGKRRRLFRGRWIRPKKLTVDGRLIYTTVWPSGVATVWIGLSDDERWVKNQEYRKLREKGIEPDEFFATRKAIREYWDFAISGGQRQ